MPFARGSNRSFAAHQAAQRAHRWHPYYARRRAYLSPVAPPIVHAAGPVFALVVPTTYVETVRPPETALHPQHVHADVVAETTYVLVLVVFLIVAGRVMLRVIECGKTDRLPTELQKHVD